MNKWFALQAVSDIPGNVENVRKLLSHPAFDLRNPNKVYSLIGGFCGSPVNFHAKDGSGYKFLGEIVAELDKLNPQVLSEKSNESHFLYYFLNHLLLGCWNIIFIANNVLGHWMQVASRMVSAFSRWRRFDVTRQNLAKVTTYHSY